MNQPTPLPPPAPCPTGANAASGEAAERRGRHLGMLAELAEIGMELARDVRRRAQEEAEAAPPAKRGADWGLVFARIARAVRQTVALEAKLAEADTHSGAAKILGAQRARNRRQKDRIRHLVEGAIASEAEGHRAENLRLDLDERLEDPDIDAELGWRPIGVIVAGICADLGIVADLRFFTDAELGMDLSGAHAPAAPNSDPGPVGHDPPYG